MHSNEYSTTRLATRGLPVIVNNPDDKFKTVLFLPYGESRKGEGGLRTKGYFKKSYNDKPLISIITVVYNGEQFLEGTIQSVIKQTYSNVEYIIIDGGSTDGTIDIIKRYEDYIDYWVSEPDKGIYDAMNKGVVSASGMWINFMNVGDCFCDDNILWSLFNTNKDFANIGVITGFVKIVDSTYKWVGYRHPYKYLNNCDFIYENCIAHQATFTSINVFKCVGLFNTNYKIQGDYEFWLRVKKKRIPFLQLKKDIAFFMEDGISSTRSEVLRSINEKYLALERNEYIPLWRLRLLYIKEVVLFYIKNFIRFFLGRKISEHITRYNLYQASKYNEDK